MNSRGRALQAERHDLAVSVTSVQALIGGLLWHYPRSGGG